MAALARLALLVALLGSSLRLCAGDSALLANLTDVLQVVNSDRISFLAIGDVLLAYRLVDPSVTFESTVGTAGINVKALSLQQLDWGTNANGLTDAQAMAMPQIQYYPIFFSAVVHMYRLDALTAAGGHLCLSRVTVAKIWAGLITNWADPLIQLDNPAVTMPNKNITLVFYNESLGTNGIYFGAFQKFWSNFSRYASTTFFPALPLASYAAYLPVTGATAGAAGVVSVDGTLGYASQAVALEMNVAMASMINKAGNVVAPTSDSVTFAAVELGTQILARSTAVLDLSDGSGGSVWPIVCPSYVMIDVTNSRSTCHARQATVDFWLWFFQSTTVSGLLTTRGFARVPDIVMTQTRVIPRLQTEVLCRGSPAYEAVASAARLRSVVPSVTFTCTLFSHIYVDPDTAVSWTVNTYPDQIIFDQMTNGEVDIGILTPYNVDQGKLALAQESGDYTFLPVYIAAHTLMFNPKIAPGVNIAGKTVRIDERTAALIWYSCILYWNDEIILQQNPWLRPLLGNMSVSPAPLLQINGCGTSVGASPILNAINAYTINWQQRNNDPSVASCLANFTAFGLQTAYDTCTPNAAYHLAFAANEATAPSLVQGTVGSIGYFQSNGDSSYSTFTFTRPDSAGGLHDANPDLTGLKACTNGSFDAVGLEFDLDNNGNAACWPWHTQNWAMIRSQYTSTAKDSSNCERGHDSLQYISWLLTEPQVDSLVNSVDIVRTTTLSPDVMVAMIGALDSITCDGTTLLITLPTVWTLTGGIAAFAQALCAIGVVGCLVVCVLVVLHRAHPVIRSASPPFLFLSVGGVLLMFASGFVLVSTASAAACSTLSWTLICGLQLTFAPLFAKTWRIYRIFGRKKLSVVQISNTKLMLLVGVIVAIDAVLMAVWQGVGPLQPIVTSINSTSSAGKLVINQYTQCGVGAGDSMSMFAVICVEKGLLFVFGALMAFTTRRVNSTFNESQGISLSIYNVCFTIGIISPIILVISAVGDVLILLEVFALLWIAYFTAGILFVPKVMTIYFHTNGDNQVDRSVMGSSSSSSGYQFLSLAALSTVPVVQGYLSALQKHVTHVESRLATLKHQKAGLAGGASNATAERSSSKQHHAPAAGTPSSASAASSRESDVLAGRAGGGSFASNGALLLGASSRATVATRGSEQERSQSRGAGSGGGSVGGSPQLHTRAPTLMKAVAGSESLHDSGGE